MGSFWSQLSGSVGTLLNALLQGRTQSDFVLVERGEIQPSIVSGDLSAPQSAVTAAPMWVQAQTQIQALQKADPDFLESTFLSQASRTFAAYLAAEGAMSADAIADTATTAFLDHFKQQIDDWRSGGVVRTVSNVTLDPPAVFKVTIGGAAQSTMVRFTGVARRFSKDAMTGLLTAGSLQVESFTEFGTFVRPAGSTTPKTGANGGPIHCPSCGAPVDPGALTCSFCRASLSGTGGAWLLDKVSASAYT